ncbi:MAG: hypothetical protein O9327_10680 [Polaromonas sp.]|nr:hypothetical protein [Polaromonas sp.]
MASYTISHQAAWTKRTWRLYKAALLFRYRSMGTPQALEACGLLRETTQSECLNRSTRTSSVRPKCFDDKDLERVIECLDTSKSSCSKILQQWLLHGVTFGLRPHEWAQTEIVYLRSADLTPDGPAAAGIWERPRPFLRVKNSKGTNGRSHGAYRHLELMDFSSERVVNLEMFLETMRDAAEDGQFERLMRQCTDVLYRINRGLHPKDKTRWIHLYSMRHRVSSNAKAQMSQREVGALMGHKTDRTATEHYGKRRSAKGGLEIKPIALEVSRVQAKKGHPQSTPSRTPDASPHFHPRSTHVK